MEQQNINQELSIALANQVGKRKTAFEKAYQAAKTIEGATYVQGFLAVKGNQGEPLEHGWLEVEEQIVDPHLPQLEQEIETLYYCPAQKFSLKKLAAIIEESEEDYPEDDPLPVYGAPPYEYYGDVMLGGKEYQQAYETALALCRSA